MNRDEIIKKCQDGVDITWEEYCSCANDTLSNNFYTDKVSFAEFHLVLTNFIKAANDLDKIKKALFYGVDHDLKDLSCWREEELLGDGTLEQWEEESNIPPQLIHSILGIAGESGELVELLLEGYYSDEFDTVNLFEELGDIFWFLHIPYKLAEMLIGYDCNKYQNTLRANLLKLDKRYKKKKFSNEQAINRNLDQERKILEANV